MRRSAVAVLLAAGLLAASCAAHTGATATAPDQQTQALWRDRTPYVGDNSKVLALMDDAGFRVLGRYTVALQTTDEPYGVTVTYEYDGPDDVPAPDRSVVMLLGTVENLDNVQVVTPGGRSTWTAEAVSQRLGHDVKDLGHDRAKLAAFVTGREG